VQNTDFETGLAFVAGDLEPLDGEATISIINTLQAERRNPNLDPEDYMCPVTFEDTQGILRVRYLPIEIGKIATFLSRGRGAFVDVARNWLQESILRRYPVFLKEVEIEQIVVKPEQ
jgi:hypothetical protein